MRAEALLARGPTDFELTEVRLPDPGADDVVVETLASGISIGTEFAAIGGDLDWGPHPMCTGYQSVGTVREVGSNVADYEVGDRVYVRRNSDLELPDGQAVNTVSGTHCSRVVVDPETSHGFGPVPDGADTDVASSFVMPAVGLNGVTMSSVEMDDLVVVHGTGAIGLGVVAATDRRGAEVVAVDLDTDRLAIAERMGAEHAIDAGTEDVKARVEEIAPEGADVVFEATGVPECVDKALELCRTHGKFVFQGHYGEEPLEFYFPVPHGKHLTAFFPCNDGQWPARRAVLEHMAEGILPWEETLTHRVEAAEAPALYTDVARGNLDPIGGVIRWIDAT